MTNNKESEMNIEDMTIGQARQIASLLGGHESKPCPFQVGQAYLIRTVTHAWTGRVREIVGDFLVLDTAAWIADTGRFHLAVSIDALDEVEPRGDGQIVGLGTVVDAGPWVGDLPSEAK